MSLEPLLEVQGISKTFNGLRVLKNVGLKVYPSVNVCACVPEPSPVVCSTVAMA
ncbi:hypothetical protein SAMN04490186_4182 [Pseudomonas grimontii]|uniref:Uncharacterized protein n=1 Tax=Pseudomonas grimontii TaxID=129847 RepID=A0ABY0TQQ8_9PSED|nr:hypothetical protein [Pseudomonas grimontii]SDR22943.1 hypothetical protein SAMN04490186_4182 [Pseudomonas grimontii]